MRPKLTPDEFKQAIAGGVLSFPLTDFSAANEFAVDHYLDRLQWLSQFPAAAVFPAGGAGEFFSLKFAEFRAVTQATVSVFRGKVPVVAAAGLGTASAIDYAQEAERLGADGLLLLPPYMTEATQQGLIEHIESVCRATRLGVIVYNRANCKLQYTSMLALAERCPNLIGFKDGLGDIESIMKVRSVVGERLLIINGMPTAEIYAQAYTAIGASTYSSALLNFVPQLAIDFHRAVQRGDETFLHLVTRRFLTPYLALRNRGAGYAVSIVKAGAELIGHGAGPVRSPLSPLSAAECEELAGLIEVANGLRPGVCESLTEPVARAHDVHHAD